MKLGTGGTFGSLFLEVTADDARALPGPELDLRWTVSNDWGTPMVVTRGDRSWTAEKYCQVFRAQAAAIRGVDPSARVAGPAVSGARPGRDQFLEAFVKHCGDVVDDGARIFPVKKLIRCAPRSEVCGASQARNC